jgi:hypothetical protein
MLGKCCNKINLLAVILIFIFPACLTSPSSMVHGTDDTSQMRGGTITREVPHSEETMKEVQDNENRNPPADNILRVAPYHKSPPPVELPPFPNLPHPPNQE